MGRGAKGGSGQVIVQIPQAHAKSKDKMLRLGMSASEVMRSDAIT